MVTILPLKGEERAAFQKKHPLIAEEDEVLWLRDGTEDIGFETVSCSEGIDSILSMQFFAGDASTVTAEHNWAVDALQRAAVSYGVNHGAAYAASRVPEIKELLRQRGFQEKDGQMVIEASRIVKICKD